jgi:exodeoxyribonuclease VII large subunit
MQLSLDARALPKALTVSQLTRRVRTTLETRLENLWVAGEISNFRVPPSGHYYFSLKDEQSQIAAVMFRNANQLLPFTPEDGMHVLAYGRVSVYEARGNLQLYVDTLEPRGQGSLQLAIEQLKQRLAAEGLFAEERKRPLPFLPAAVGIVTAATGAAIHDMLVTLRARMPCLRIIVRAATVQGKEAVPDIIAAIADLNRYAEVDVILVGRGGGSLEDLWAFNDEKVARAIVASRIPVVSAVGHEIDVTIADLVADRRAPTPTGAAMLVVPDRRDLLATLRSLGNSLTTCVQYQIERHRERLTHTARRLRDPRQAMKALQLRVDEMSERLQRAIAANLGARRQDLRRNVERLEALSPLAVLHRGYSITRRADGSVVRDAQNLTANEVLNVRFARGSAAVRVETVGQQDDDEGNDRHG